jgi:hypothetical protein
VVKRKQHERRRGARGERASMSARLRWGFERVAGRWISASRVIAGDTRGRRSRGGRGSDLTSTCLPALAGADKATAGLPDRV